MNTSSYPGALASSAAVSQDTKIPVAIFEEVRMASRQVAEEIANLIRERAAQNRTAVLGLATGASPILVYEELIRLHREAGLSFANVVTFNLDEYHPLPREDARSYYRFMTERMFEHIDIKKDHIHIPDGTISREKLPAYCEAYEKSIAEEGGIDLQLLGIGRTGHIGFNEPGSPRNSITRLVQLDHITRKDARKNFQSEELVPYEAITVGVKTILQARRIVIMAFGEAKAAIVARVVEGAVSSAVPATYLQEHPNCVMVLDRAAASQLTR